MVVEVVDKSRINVRFGEMRGEGVGLGLWVDWVKKVMVRVEAGRYFCFLFGFYSISW